ncbi:MAG: FHIPEP family type III secretion protein, partial [Pseudomonadota bacterium]
MAKSPSPFSGMTTKSAMGMFLRGDVALATGIVIILLFMLVPMPPVLVDAGLAISITLSIMILMITLFIKKPLEFSTFPTILLITTALRLGMNIASTRLILSQGHEGTDSAGHIIEAFGVFMMQGN